MDGYDLRDASHDEAVEIIKRAKNPVRFVVRTVNSNTGQPTETSSTPEVSLNNQVRMKCSHGEYATLITATYSESRYDPFLVIVVFHILAINWKQLLSRLSI